MADLKTNYKDDIPAESENEKRRYNVIHNADGTITLEDATEYTQKGDDFGAADINATNAKVNVLNESLSGIDIRINAESGEPEWSARGADTWSPFRNEPVLLWKGTGAKQNNITCTFDYSPYTHIRIDFKDSKSLLLKCGTTPIVLAEWSAYYSNSIGRRLISFISSGITCNTLDASGNGGAYMIPLAIYGIK